MRSDVFPVVGEGEIFKRANEGRKDKPRRSFGEEKGVAGFFDGTVVLGFGMEAVLQNGDDAVSKNERKIAGEGISKKDPNVGFFQSFFQGKCVGKGFCAAAHNADPCAQVGQAGRHLFEEPWIGVAHIEDNVGNSKLKF